MAQILSIQDTHKLDYKNATVTARRYGTTTPIPFFQSDGTTLGLEVYINAKGYLCNSGGSLYTSGVFVHERAEITVTFKNGDSTSWIVAPDESEQIHDGKLYGEDPNNPGQYIEIFSANSENPGYLAWENILRKPSFNIWYESETVVKMTQADDTVDSAITDLQFTKTMTIIKDDNLATPVSLKIIPDNERTGQVIAVRNLTGYPILLKNSDDSAICHIEPCEEETDRLELIVLFGSIDRKFHRFGDAEMYPAILEISNVGSFGLPIQITDSTPDVILMHIQDSIRDLMMQNNAYVGNLEANIACSNSSERRVKFWLQNEATYGGITINYGGNPLFVANNGEIVELVIPSKTARDNGNIPVVISKSHDGVVRELPELTWDTLFASVGNAMRLPVGQGTAVINVDTDNYNTIDITLDGKSEQMTLVTVKKTAGQLTVNFLSTDGGTYATFIQNNNQVIYAFQQKGQNVVSLGRIGEGSGTPSEPINPTSSLEYSDVYNGSTLKLNINYLVSKSWTDFGETNNSSDKTLTLFVDVPNGETTDFTLDVDPYMTTYHNYEEGQVSIKLAAPGGTGSTLIFGVATAGEGTPVKCANYIQPQKILVHASRSGTTLSFTSEVLP